MRMRREGERKRIREEEDERESGRKSMNGKERGRG